MANVSDQAMATWRHSSARSRGAQSRGAPFKSAPSGDEALPLSTVVYKSRAVRSLSPADLFTLTTAAKARNGREAITSLMVYDEGHFFQWLEGPAENVGRVMKSIRSDPRHADIEVLKDQNAKARTFADWHMKLATRGQPPVALADDVIRAPREIVEHLRERPHAAPDLLIELVAVSAAEKADSAMCDAITQLPLKQRTAAVLKQVLLAKVIPGLARECGVRPAQAPVWLASPRVAELADLLVGPAPEAALDLVRELAEDRTALAPLFATLFEPAARRLGDLWGEDFCSEFDVTVGLCRLQSAARLLSASAGRLAAGRLRRPLVLIAPVPGELHRLGASLDRTVLEGAGWSPQAEYPADVHALQDLLADSWFDVLDLSLSAAFRREDRLPHMHDTIAEAREASRNPALVVIVGGRMFVEDRSAALQVGADLATTTALSLDRVILKTLSTAATPLRQLEVVASAS